MLRDELPGCGKAKKPKIIIEENHYHLGKLLGSGTFGKVFEAIDKKTGARVAIKEVLQDKRYKNRELDVISRLDNDNIVFMRDYYFINKKQEKYLYIVMDYYETSLQGILKQYRKQKKVFSPLQRKILIFQMFKGLYYLSSNNVCHRDLKPPNILLNLSTLQLRICDFGSAKILDKIQKNVHYICSRYYRAPQLLFQYSGYRTQIDVWSIGCIIVELMTNQPIFPGDSALEQLIEIIKIIGTPSEQYMRKYASPEINQEITLPKIGPTGWAKILKKYKPEQQLIEIINGIFTYDIKKRLTPFEVLKHSYFKDLNENEKYEPMLQKLPSFFDFQRLRNVGNGNQIKQLKEIYFYKKGDKIKQKQSQQGLCTTGDSTPLQQITNNSFCTTKQKGK